MSRPPEVCGDAAPALGTLNAHLFTVSLIQQGTRTGGIDETKSGLIASIFSKTEAKLLISVRPSEHAKTKKYNRSQS